MQASSSLRSRTAFVPWLAALVIGASAHAGWLVHEFGDQHQPSSPRFAHMVNIAVMTPVEASPVREPAPRTRRVIEARARSTHCRYGQAPSLEIPAFPWSELDFLITRTGRHEYAVDRELFTRVEFGGGGASEHAFTRFARLLGVGVDGAVELRNIRRETPLWHLGLRTGDRLLAISPSEGVDAVAVQINRRGRSLVLTYRVV